MLHNEIQPLLMKLKAVGTLACRTFWRLSRLLLYRQRKAVGVNIPKGTTRDQSGLCLSYFIEIGQAVFFSEEIEILRTNIHM